MDQVDVTLIVKKSVKLRTQTGNFIFGNVHVFESDSPYALIFMISYEENSCLRMDAGKADIAMQLKKWMDGEYVKNPCVVISSEIEEAIIKYVKFNSPPKPSDLVMWILSRTEICDYQDPYRIAFAQLQNETSSVPPTGKKQGTMFSSKTKAGMPIVDMNSRAFNKSQSTKNEITNMCCSADDTDDRPPPDYHSTAEISKQLLGTRSESIHKLSKDKVHGRQGAKAALSTNSWSEDQHRLASNIERSRKEIERAVEARRLTIAVGTVRQQQTSDRFRTVREEIKMCHGNGAWTAGATEEVVNLHKIQLDIEDDIRRQKIRTQRDTQRLAWTMAPNGCNLGGKSKRGPLLGPGPLPAHATTSQVDPRLASTMKNYYWDESGRRHVLSKAQQNQQSGASIVEQALERIRSAATNFNASKTFGLNLKYVFKKFDTSGDGFLSLPEMVDALIAMGIHLDIESTAALFRHFDPNDSGSVDYGEFVWAFFNRRKLLQQWKHISLHLTDKQIIDKFHRADTSGDGKLSLKEFKKFLVKLGLKFENPEDLDILIDRFDVDGDGELDVNEFLSYMQSEAKGNSGEAKAVSAKSSKLSSQNSILRTHNPKKMQSSKPPGYFEATTGELPPPSFTDIDENFSDIVMSNDGNLSKTSAHSTSGKKGSKGGMLNRTAPFRLQNTPPVLSPLPEENYDAYDFKLT